MGGRVEFVQVELAGLSDPARSARMAAYMKTDAPFYGVRKPALAPVFREMLARFPVRSRADYTRSVLELWALPHREEKYLAIDLARAYPAYRTIGSMPLYRRLIVEGAWWDLVDGVAADLVGGVLRDDQTRGSATVRRWIDHPDLWLRRTAIICQLRHRADTDEAMLFDFCLRRAHEREFFIRKAIGWALREYAKTAPEQVRAFVLAHRGRWSGLTFREATKHL